jgi:hypothetical protein
MNDSATDKQVLILKIRGKRNAALQHDDSMFGPRQPQKTHAYYRRTDPAGSGVDREGAAAPSASTPPSAKSDRASDGNTGEGSLRPRGLHQRTTLAPHPGHRCQGLLQEPGPSRRLGRPPRSLSQLSPRTPARLMASATRLQHRSRQWMARPGFGRRSSLFRANFASVRADTATSGSGSSQSGRGFL